VVGQRVEDAILWSSPHPAMTHSVIVITSLNYFNLSFLVVASRSHFAHWFWLDFGTIFWNEQKTSFDDQENLETDHRMLHAFTAMHAGWVSVCVCKVPCFGQLLTRTTHSRQATCFKRLTGNSSMLKEGSSDTHTRTVRARCIFRQQHQEWE